MLGENSLKKVFLMNLAYNLHGTDFRKIFEFHKFESIRSVLFSRERPRPRSNLTGQCQTLVK